LALAVGVPLSGALVFFDEGPFRQQ
jgi:hypothetical protein